MIRRAFELERLRALPRRLLAVFPHPDDESYGVAGALARQGADEAGAAVLLCLTRGEASSLGRERGLTPDEVGRLRAGRLAEVAQVLDLDALLLPGLPDGGLARMALAELVQPVREALEALAPQVVLTHDPRGVNAHPDHIAAHWAVRVALEGLPATRLAMVVYTEEVVEAARPRLIFATPEAEIDVTLTLTRDEVRKKEACLRIHEAHTTLVDTADPRLLRRPPAEHYDLLGERLAPRGTDLFQGLGAAP